MAGRTAPGRCRRRRPGSSGPDRAWSRRALGSTRGRDWSTAPTGRRPRAPPASRPRTLPSRPASRNRVCRLVQMSQFVDEAQLNVRGGDGGAGCVSFRREGPVAKGGPNGGDGGKGGDVWLVADHNVASLLAFRDHPHRRAGNGVHGKGKDMHGRTGDDEVVLVPEGTLVHDLYTGEVLAE